MIQMNLYLQDRNKLTDMKTMSWFPKRKEGEE